MCAYEADYNDRGGVIMVVKWTCWICGKEIKPNEFASSCGGEPYHAFHDNEEATNKIPGTWAFQREHGGDSK